MEIIQKQTLCIAIGAGFAIGVGVFIWGKQKRWVKVGKVENLYIFPLKSGAPIESNKMKFASMGPKLNGLIDRGFAVANVGTYTVRDTHSFPRLCLMSISMAEDETGDLYITIKSPDAEADLVFQLPTDFSSEPAERFVSTSVIGGKCSSVFDCGEVAASWLSKVLKKKESGLRLIYHYSEVSMRSHNPTLVKLFGNTMQPSFLPALSHTAPYHLVTTSSVSELNKKMNNTDANKVTALNFRPNLVVKTLSDKPFQEDWWKQVRIGSVGLEYSLPDNRCQTVNYNQLTAEKDVRVLKWINSNRRILSKEIEKVAGPDGVFGHRYGLKVGSEGYVNKGDDVWAYLSRF